MTEARGRRAAAERSRRPTLPTVLAVALPVLTVVSLVLVGAPGQPDPPRDPESAPLSRTTLVCPGPSGDDVVGVSHSDADLGGRVQQQVPDGGPLVLRPGRVSTLREETRSSPVVLVAEGELAPGPLAGRWGDAGAAPCTPPAPESWFTGLAAGAERSSVLELVNPDGGPAIADVTLLTPTGPIEPPRLRGIRVPGRSALDLDLGELVPSRQALALRVVVARGRLGATVRDEADPVGGGRATTSRVPGQAAPATTSYLPGAGEGRQPVLTLANPGDDEARVSIEVVTDRSEFAPAGVEEIRVPPGSVEVVDLGDVLAGAAAEKATGLLVRSTQPVTAGARSVVGGEPAHVVAAEPVSGLAGAVLPRGDKRLVVAGPSAEGTAHVVARDAAGKVVADERVAVAPGRSGGLDLPATAQVVVVRMDGASAALALRLGGAHPSLVPLAGLQLNAQVPDVRPALG